MKAIALPPDDGVVADVYIPTWNNGDRAYLLIQGRLPANRTKIGFISGLQPGQQTGWKPQ